MVHKAVNIRTQDVVAIKILFQASDQKIQAKNLVELRSFQKIPKHPNLVQLIEVFKNKQD